MIAAGNWGSIHLGGYTVEVPAGTRALSVHKLSRFTVGGDKVTFAKKVPYDLKISDASRLVPNPALEEPRTLLLEVKESWSAKLEP